MRLWSCVPLCFSLMSFSSLAQGRADTQQEMHGRVLALYSFAPHLLSNDERAAKSKAMDGFWDQVKASPDSELPLLRAELARKDDPSFFMTDGSALLLSLSHTRPDEILAAEAMSRCDLKDVTPSAYFYAVHALSMDGVDTTSAPFHILDEPGFTVPVPQHPMTLDVLSALPFLLLPMDEALWIPAARARFRTAEDEGTLRALLNLFFYSQTAASDDAIAEASRDPRLSASVRKDALAFEAEARKALTIESPVQGDQTQIREARRKRLGVVSDEAIADVQDMTLRLVQLRHRKP